MLRQRNFMSRHNQEQQEEIFVATKLLRRNIPFEYSTYKALKYVITIIRKIQQNSVATLSKYVVT